MKIGHWRVSLYIDEHYHIDGELFYGSFDVKVIIA